MNKNQTKGFTIIELIVTISIVGIIALMALGVYFGVNNTQRDNVYATKVDLIKNAGERFAESIHLEDSTTISVQDLIASGFLDADIDTGEVYDPRDPSKKILLNCDKIHLKIVNGNVEVRYETAATSHQKTINCPNYTGEGNNNSNEMTITAKEVGGSVWGKTYTNTTLTELPWTRYNVEITAGNTVYTAADIARYEWYQSNNLIASATTNKYTATTTTLLNARFVATVVPISASNNRLSRGIIVKIDKVAPATPAITNPYGGTTWTKGNITLTLRSSDTGSGLKEYQYCWQSCTVASNWHTWANSNKETFIPPTITGLEMFPGISIYNPDIYIRAVDNVGNVSAVASTRINIDRTPPSPPTWGWLENNTGSGNWSFDHESGFSHYEYYYIGHHVNIPKPPWTVTNTTGAWDWSPSDKGWGWQTTPGYTYTKALHCDWYIYGYVIGVDKVGNRSEVYEMANSPIRTMSCCDVRWPGDVCSSWQVGTTNTCDGVSVTCTHEYRCSETHVWTLTGNNVCGPWNGNMRTFYCSYPNTYNCGNDENDPDGRSNWCEYSGGLLINYFTETVCERHSLTCNCVMANYYYWR